MHNMCQGRWRETTSSSGKESQTSRSSHALGECDQIVSFSIDHHVLLSLAHREPTLSCFCVNGITKGR